MHRCSSRAAAVVALLGLMLAPAATGQPASPQGETRTRPSKQYTIEQFLDTVSISGASFSSDESRILFSSNKTGIWNVYSVAVTGGEWTQITSSTTDSTYSVGYFPHDDRILFTRDQGGNELNHLYVRTPEGQERDLTPGQKLKAAFAGWSPDGSAFFVSSNERDPRFFDLYKYDAKTYERALFFKNEGGYFPSDISDDQKWVALTKINTTADSDIYLWNAATNEVRHLTPHEGEAQYSPAAFDPSSGYLYYLTNDGGEFTRLRRFAIADGRHEDVDRADWDIVFAGFSHKGRYRVTAINEDGRTAVKVVDAASGTPASLPSIPNGNVSGLVISRSESKLALLLNGDRSPNDLYVLPLGSRGQAVKLTSSLSPAIDPADLVDSEVVRFKARDGMTIPNILYKPHQATATARAPALVWVHGGPGGQTTQAYNSVIQYLVNHGYVVLGINNRGSSGYGKTFFAADDKKHGREPLWDCVDAKQHLAGLPYVDANRVGIIGGSYGGYMVLAALAFQPDAFDVGIDIFGVSNWVRTLDSIPAWWEAQRKALYAEIGDVQADAQMLRDVSPLFHAERIRKPLLVLQGANDPRVIKPESDDIVAAVKKNGVPVEYIVFEDEGHGFSKKKNQIEGYGAVLRFLDRHLKGKTATAAPSSR
ncbi:MAG TPA: prolyl oligopeptidase family serine peptidase [Vicinamibacterales bacterium]|nr:prolyl oligopeptidase family serine peptidase [Vicinamibacterales bacterium]